MWIPRYEKKDSFFKRLLNLKEQVLILRGARQVGKTSFILDAFQELKDYPKVFVNFLYPSEMKLEGPVWDQGKSGEASWDGNDNATYGRDFFGRSETGEEFLKNLLPKRSSLPERPLLVFIDEVDRYPIAMEAIQTLAQFSDQIKFVFTGSNLENMKVKNSATGRKTYFDLYPITFYEFLQASPEKNLAQIYRHADFSNPFTQWQHNKLQVLFNDYLRIGGLPKIVSKYFDPDSETQDFPEMIADLVVTIEENVKTVLEEKTKLYEYEDILRKLAMLSLNTLKFTHLQTQHANRSEAKKLVAKTVGARVAHKIRLFDSEKDLSKYILFDCGVLNYLLNGSDLLKNRIPEKNLAVLLENFVGNELIAHLTTRDDLFYWKSQNKAEIEFVLRSPYFVGIDVKSKVGNNKSLNSMAVFEEGIDCLVKVGHETLSFEEKHLAKLPNYGKKTSVPFLKIPHYLVSRLVELVGSHALDPKAIRR